MEWLNKLSRNKRLPLIAGGLLLGLVLIIFGSTDSGQSGKEAAPAVGEDMRQTARQLEEEITILLQEIPGVDRVKVMVYPECSDEEVYGAGEDHPVRRNSARLLGIGVVCPGAGDELTLEITRLLSALFGLATNKIYVTG